MQAVANSILVSISSRIRTPVRPSAFEARRSHKRTLTVRTDVNSDASGNQRLGIHFGAMINVGASVL